jgi:DNA-binding winged helix-turn-helix (wHTH) protein
LSRKLQVLHLRSRPTKISSVDSSFRGSNLREAYRIGNQTLAELALTSYLNQNKALGNNADLTGCFQLMPLITEVSVQQSHTASHIVRFGTFELDVQEGRLTKSGRSVRLQGQPFQILELLLENAGQVVTREEMRRKLWSDETFVEFDDALNTAVRKLRAALGDRADNPRFLETVPRRGYRFIAPVALPSEFELTKTEVEVPSQDDMDLKEEPIATCSSDLRVEAGDKIRWSRVTIFLLAGIVVIAGAIGIIWRARAKAFRMSAKDTILVADFLNTTGQSIFDDSLRKGVEIGLEQSPPFNILPDRKALLIMKQMGLPAEDRMIGRTALEVCQRSESKAVIQGSIVSLGRSYLVGLAAIRCDTGHPISNEQIQVEREEDVRKALDLATDKLRERLGKSLSVIHK